MELEKHKLILRNFFKNRSNIKTVSELNTLLIIHKESNLKGILEIKHSCLQVS